MAVTWIVSCDFWGLSGSHDAALSVVSEQDPILVTHNPTPSSVDPREGEIRRPCCITANFATTRKDQVVTTALLLLSGPALRKMTSRRRRRLSSSPDEEVAHAAAHPLTLPNLVLAQLPLEGIWLSCELEDLAALILTCSATLRPYSQGCLWLHLARLRFHRRECPSAFEACLALNYDGDARRLFLARPAGLRHDGVYAELRPRRPFRQPYWRVFRFFPSAAPPSPARKTALISAGLHLKGEGDVLILSTTLPPRTAAHSLESLAVARAAFPEGLVHVRYRLYSEIEEGRSAIDGEVADDSPRIRFEFSSRNSRSASVRVLPLYFNGKIVRLANEAAASPSSLPSASSSSSSSSSLSSSSTSSSSIPASMRNLQDCYCYKSPRYDASSDPWADDGQRLSEFQRAIREENEEERKAFFFASSPYPWKSPSRSCDDIPF